MARSKQHQPYLLEEPTTGLYIVAGRERPELTACAKRAGHSTARAAVLASQTFADQPHELVRVDA